MQGSARDALPHRSSQCQRRRLIRPQGDLSAALRAARSGCGSAALLPQGNSVDDRRQRLLTEREIQVLFGHRQGELRSPLQSLREI